MLSRPHSRTPGCSSCACCARDLLFCALLCIVCALLLGACCARVWWVCARDSALCARLFIVCALLFIFCAQLSSAFCARVLWVGARGFCFLCATFYFLCANLGHFLCALFVGLCAGFNFLCATFYFLCAILTPIVYRCRTYPKLPGLSRNSSRNQSYVELNLANFQFLTTLRGLRCIPWVIGRVCRCDVRRCTRAQRPPNSLRRLATRYL